MFQPYHAGGPTVARAMPAPLFAAALALRTE